MTLNEYQVEAVRTANPADDFIRSVTVLALGVAGEAGEVADHVKKFAGHGHPLDHERLLKELGDVPWYVAVLARQLGCDLDAVAQANVAKLRARYPDGFSSERSINREATP